jgi:unsaturated rhamnogalacturonyl hydrolase
MAQPLYMEYETRYNGMENYSDILEQFRNVRRFLRDEKTGLYFHGYDEARVQPWADPVTGCSANFWSRAYGWWLIALVDTLEAMNIQIYEQYAELKDLLQESVKSLLNYRSEEDGLIYQLISKGDLKGNYTESSGSVMAAAAIMKAVRLNLLLAEKYLPAGKEMFESVCERKLRPGEDGIVRLQDICHVAGLGPGEKRDGSVEYYLSEPISADDAKGVGPFLMAYAEYLRLA